MFWRKKKQKRIEPGFGGPQGSVADLRVGPEDRAVVNASAGSGDRAKAKPADKSSSPGKRGRATTTSKSRSGSKRRKASSKNAKRSLTSRLIRSGIYWGFVLGIWGVIAVGAIVAFYAAKLPQTTTWTVPERPPNARIVSVDGTLVANRGATGGEAMPLDQMSPYIPMAVIAIEDHRFKYHFGFDPIGFTRAMVANLQAGRLVQGGSTLSQQLAKNLFLEPERTFERKVQELVLAVWLETKFTKDEILELYLNRVYFGSGAYGVDAASRRYFSKSSRDVNLAEAALLAGLLRAPSRLSPARNPEAAENRAQVVLAAMRREGFVNDRETARALTMQAKKAKRYWSGSEHYVADLVMKELPDLVGDLKTDVIVDTTIDLDLQKQAGNVIANTIAIHGKEKNVKQGALISMDATGAIRALVGGREYADSQFNRATEAKRQPGSAFKPFVYLSALEADRSPDSVREDAPVKIGNWTPSNYDRRYRGPVTLSTALSSSLNTIAAQLVMEVGPKRVIETAKRLGIQSDLQRNASISLGTSEVSLYELTRAYVPFANGGYRVEPYIIKRVRDLDGNVLYERDPTTNSYVINARELGMMNVMLRDVIEDGTGKRAAFGNWQVAGKTGTTQNSRDGLFVGYTANLITGVWYGNDNGKPMKKVTGGTLPAESFAKFMGFAHKGVPVADLPGNYVPVASIVPTARPRAGGNPGNVLPGRNVGGANQPSNVDIAADRNSGQNSGRRSLNEIEGGSPRPSTGLGRSGQEKPRTIMDIIFGG